MNKRAYFFSLDAFIALLVILGVVFFVRPSSVNITPDSKLQDDLLLTLSSVKIGEIDNAYAQTLIDEGKITNLNQSVLEQIGEFYAKSDPEAELLAENIIQTMNLEENLGLYFNEMPIAVSASSSIDDSEDVWISRKIISGIQEGNSSRGYSSRAFLFSENKVNYFYFGGYVGDGNITIDLGKNVTSANLEAMFSGDFDLYLNNGFLSHHSPTSGVPYKVTLPSEIFFQGDNNLSFRSDSNLYIAGGYIKAVYGDAGNFTSYDKINFPGIDGIINLYDSFYVPGVLNNLEIFLHFKSATNIFLNIGDTEVYRGNSGAGETTLLLNSSYLSSLLSYSQLSRKTIPFRLGLEGVEYESNYTFGADAFTVTDMSSSMNAQIPSLKMKMLQLVKNANHAFVNTMLQTPSAKVGLITYNDDVDIENFHSLSEDATSLNNTIKNWFSETNTCLCCGINRAVQEFSDMPSGNRYQSMVVLSDGNPNVDCADVQGTGSAKQDAINAACDAYNLYNIVTYVVGFGDGSDAETLQAIADCGHGIYYAGNINSLISLYQSIADNILNASYAEQTVVGTDLDTELFADSYVSFNSEKTFPYGMIITSETNPFNNGISEGIFEIPSGTEPYSARVVSYSGARWTDNVAVYNVSSGIWENIFNLSDYDSEYIHLGDPYAVEIPLNKIVLGNNTVRVSTGLNSANSSGGSVYDKVVYSVVKNLAGYSPIVASKKGCNWFLEFEDGTNSSLTFPTNYSGDNQCSYSSGNLIYNNNDAIDGALLKLFSNLDLNSNGKIETKFSENDLTIDSVEINGIPFTWETEVQVRVWR